MLNAKQIDVFYGLKPVLQSVSLEINEGEVIGVIGPNGAGKSTLIRALSGVIPIKNGAISIGQKNIHLMGPGERARQMAVVSQASILPPAFTGWEVVLLGRTPYLNWLGQASETDRIAARQAMEFTGSTNLAHSRIGELSGGERQRLLLARALAQDTPIILMDEPTTHLDLHHQFHILEKLGLLARQHHKAVLISLHDINLVARYTDQVILLDEGKMIAKGKPREVLQSDLLSAIYKTPLKVVEDGQTPFIFPAG